MTQISSLSKARSAGRYGVSLKLRNAADGLIWLTEGRHCALSGRRYVHLVVNQTMAANMPSQQTRNAGQMLPYKQDRLYVLIGAIHHCEEVSPCGASEIHVGEYPNEWL